MKKLLSITILSFFAFDAFADDWRMRKFDLNDNNEISKAELIQSGCRIEHHNLIGNFCDLNPNLTTGGFTKIGNYCEINISVDIINRISIGNFSRVGAGSLFLKNIKDKELHYGRPAKFVRKNK